MTKFWIFDFDNTIARLEPEVDWAGGRLQLEPFLRSVGAPADIFERIPRGNLPLYDAYRKLLVADGIGPSERQNLRSASAMIEKIELAGVDRAKPLEGAIALLAALRDRGAQVAIVSSNSSRTIRRWFELHPLPPLPPAAPLHNPESSPASHRHPDAQAAGSYTSPVIRPLRACPEPVEGRPSPAGDEVGEGAGSHANAPRDAQSVPPLRHPAAEALSEVERGRLPPLRHPERRLPESKDLNAVISDPPDWIAVIVGRDSMLPLKPAPDMIIRALEQLSARADDAAFVGDSEADFVAARSAHVRFYGIAHDDKSRDRLLAAGAGEIYSSPAALSIHLNLIFSSS
ncbi:MAG: HAD family hydrolase [Candidatus Binatus sp.]|nr:HAD family hydrolase [Candidatus Binatus sp.]